MSTEPQRPDGIQTRGLSGLITRVRVEGEDQPDTSNRYEFTASTDGAVPMWGIYSEILDHSPQCVRMDWAKSGNAPVLWMHDRYQIRGVIEDARLEPGKMILAVRLGNSPDAVQLAKDIDDGIIRNVSIGYRVYQEEVDSRQLDDDGYTVACVWRATDWELKEVSFVTVPADTDTGFGRDEESAQSRVRFLEGRLKAESERTTMSETATISVTESEKNRSDAVTAERERIAGINIVVDKAREAGIGDFAERAREAIKNGESLAEFQRFAIDNIKKTEPVTTESLGLTEKEQKRYSLMNVVDGLVEGDKKRFEFEKEVSVAAQKANGHGDGERVCIPVDVLLRGWNPSNPALAMRMGLSERERTLISVSASTANVSNLVPRELMADMFIESLRENNVLLSRATILPGLVGDVDIPIELTSPQFYWIGEDAEPTEGEWTASQVPFRFKTIGARIPITRRASKQSTPNVESVLAGNLRRGCGLAIEKRAWFGVGSSTVPTGILSTSGIGDVATGGTLSFANVLELRSDVAVANAPVDACEFFTNSIGVARMRGTAISPEDATRIASYQNGILYCEGKPVRETNLIPSNLGASTNRSAILFGDPSSVYIAMWGGMEIGVDLATKAPTGGKVLRIFQDLDIKVPQAARWSAIQDLL